MKKQQTKLVRLDVVPHGGTWRVVRDGSVVVVGMPTQRDAIGTARAIAARLVLQGARGVTVRVHRRDGRVRDEFTRPRSADPRRSRG